MNKQDLQQIGKLLDEELKPIKSGVSSLKSDVSELKKDMKEVKANVQDLLETAAKILANMVTKKEFDELESRVTVLEHS